jgi:hypothetical protein
MGPKSYSYAVSVKGFKNFDKVEVALQELKAFTHEADKAVLEVVRPEVASRPLLDELIENLTSEDYLYIYSIETFFKGKKNNGLEYYKKILEKGINLMVYDFSGSVCKLSEFSNVCINSCSFQLEKKETPIEEQVQNVVNYLNSRNENYNASTFKRKSDKISFAFMNIYFAYEGYEITTPKALELVKKYCNIENKRTFYRTASEFERSTEYSFWFDDHYFKDPDFIRLPKRCGGVPEEYFQIKELIETYSSDLTEEQKITMAIAELNIFISPRIYMRWDLDYKKVPKPRNTIPRLFKEESLENNNHNNDLINPGCEALRRSPLF